LIALTFLAGAVGCGNIQVKDTVYSPTKTGRKEEITQKDDEKTKVIYRNEHERKIMEKYRKEGITLFLEDKFFKEYCEYEGISVGDIDTERKFLDVYRGVVKKADAIAALAARLQ